MLKFLCALLFFHTHVFCSVHESTAADCGSDVRTTLSDAGDAGQGQAMIESAGILSQIQAVQECMASWRYPAIRSPAGHRRSQVSDRQQLLLDNLKPGLAMFSPRHPQGAHNMADCLDLLSDSPVCPNHSLFTLVRNGERRLSFCPECAATIMAVKLRERALSGVADLADQNVTKIYVQPAHGAQGAPPDTAPENKLDVWTREPFAFEPNDETPLLGKQAATQNKTRIKCGCCEQQ